MSVPLLTCYHNAIVQGRHNDDNFYLATLSLFCINVLENMPAHNSKALWDNALVAVARLPQLVQLCRMVACSFTVHVNFVIVQNVFTSTLNN